MLISPKEYLHSDSRLVFYQTGGYDHLVKFTHIVNHHNDFY